MDEVTDDFLRGRAVVHCSSDRKHDAPYLLTAKDGEFLVTLKPLPHLDSTHVVFGRAPKAKVERLRLKLLIAAARDDNAAAVRDDKQRRARADRESRDQREANKEQWQDELKARGLESRAYMLETADLAARRQAKAEEKSKRKEAFGWDVFNADSLHKAYEKRLAKLPTGDNEHMDPLTYGTTPADRGVDNMVKELHERYADNAKFSRRRPEVPGADVDYINERNKHFNKKIKRAFDKYTVEIRQNLERGSAI